MTCGKQFVDTFRLQPTLLWQEYTTGKQTYKQLSVKYGCSAKTIQRKIDTVPTTRHSHFQAVVNVLMDTTYFGRKFGVMVFKDNLAGQILYKQYVRQETNKGYLYGIEEIARRGRQIQAVICDGRKGLLALFVPLPFQMCNFHQVAIIRRYLTKKPKL